MLDKAKIPTDAVSLLALAFGAAVIIPSVISLLLSLLAVGGALF